MSNVCTKKDWKRRAPENRPSSKRRSFDSEGSKRNSRYGGSEGKVGGKNGGVFPKVLSSIHLCGGEKWDQRKKRRGWKGVVGKTRILWTIEAWDEGKETAKANGGKEGISS